MRILLHDLKYATRMLTRSPGFALVAVLTLALGIGANTAIFTVVNALLLRPLPYADPDRLVMVWQDLRARGGPADEWATPGNYADWRARRTLFEERRRDRRLAADAHRRRRAGADSRRTGHARILRRARRHAGARPHVPARRRCARTRARVAVISHALWMRRFGGDPAVVGRIDHAGRRTARDHRRAAGGVPADRRRRRREIWRPLRINTAQPSRGAIVLRAVAAGSPTA